MVSIDLNKCIHCDQCAENCAVHALIPDKDGNYRCGHLLCFRCGQCVAICPTGAVTMENAEEPIEYVPADFDLEPDRLLNAMRFRRSIRHFTGEKVSRKEIEKLLDAGRIAPTSSNSQSVRFTVLDGEFETLRPRIWESFGKMVAGGSRKGLFRRYEQYLEHPDRPDTMFYGATQMIAVTSNIFIDGCLALANMELLAHTMGIGALYCGFATRAIAADEELRTYFGITDERQLCGCLIIGKTDLKFHRTAPRNPANVNWK